MVNDPIAGVRLDNFRLAQRLLVRLLALDANNGTQIAPVALMTLSLPPRSQDAFIQSV
jgi:hypothetical protein